MTLEEQVNVLENADMLRIIRDGEEIYTGYLAAFAPRVGHHECEEYSKYRLEEVKRFRAVPEITHRRWKGRNLQSPLRPEETPDFRFSDLQMKLYYTIYL